jgi:hypothetical protein
VNLGDHGQPDQATRQLPCPRFTDHFGISTTVTNYCADQRTDQPPWPRLADHSGQPSRNRLVDPPAVRRLRPLQLRQTHSGDQLPG